VIGAPAQDPGAPAPEARPGLGSGPIAGPAGQPGGPAAAKAEGGPTLPEAAEKIDPSTFQVHLRQDPGPQAMLAASTRSTPVSEVAPQAQATPVPAVPLAVPTPPVAQVDSGVRWMLKSGAQEAHLQLHPDSLGQVTIHLRVEGGEVHARLWVSEPASVQAVQEGRPHLELSLKEQGLQLGSFDLQQGHRPFQDAPATPASPFLDRRPVLPARQETPSIVTPTLSNPHQIELYA